MHSFYKELIPLWLIIAIVFIQQIGQAQDKAPKDYAVHFGYAHHLRLPFENTAVDGLSVELDHSWQLSGFNGGRKAYITVPLGYKYFIPRKNGVDNARILFYGWKVRHELKKGNPNWQPFLGYALLLDQLWLDGRKGNTIGHETRFTIGVDRRIKGKLAYIFSLDYSYTRFPQLDVKKAPKAMLVGLKMGLRF